MLNQMNPGRGGKPLRVIKNNQVMEDGWQRIEAGTDIPGTGDIIVPLSVWKEHGNELINRSGRVGVCLPAEEEPAVLEDDLEQLEMIALDFSVFKDGRSYSNARLLRDRYGYKGELRAVGDVLRDQIYYMSRCGIDSFQIRTDKDITDAINGLTDFSVTYQTAADGALPVSKQRNA